MRMYYAREDSKLRWRSIAELPPVAERMQSPYDSQAHLLDLAERERIDLGRISVVDMTEQFVAAMAR